MPADRELALSPGRRGLNLRDHPSTLRDDELQDALNWRIAQRGALEKRLGFSHIGVLPAAITELFTFRVAGELPRLVAYCADGSVNYSEDGATWAEVADGFATAEIPQFVQYLDVLYWITRTDGLWSWDGTAPAAAIASAPDGEHLTVWRNRLWIASERTVYWSGAGDPADWTNVANNFQTFPDGPLIEGLATVQNVTDAGDGADGVLVFTSRSFYRIVDDADNDPMASPPVITGGAYVLVDGSQGTISHRSFAQMRGRLYFLSHVGVCSTDGHDRARLESRKLGPVFDVMMSYAQAANATGIAHEGRYLLSFTPTGGTANTRLLELYLDFPPDEEGQWPWMPHDIPAGPMTHFPVASKDEVFFGDTSLGDTAYLRRMFTGGTDADGDEDELPIAADARTGAYLFEIETPKILRRAFLLGDGSLQVAVASDFEQSVGDFESFNLVKTGEVWSVSDLWNQGVWGPTSGLVGKAAYFQKRGRYFSFAIRESGSGTTTMPSRLGLGVAPAGGARVNVLQLTLIPLDCR